MYRFDGAGISDVGLVRDHNEDSAFVSPYLAVVADGVGGAAAGEVASATAAYALAATGMARFGDDPAAILAAGAATAHRDLVVGVRSDVERAGMATTLTALITDGHRVLLGHVGDSRCYRLRDRVLTQVSVDHTYVQSLVETGRLQRAQVPSHPWRNVVLRSLDGNPQAADATLDIVELDVIEGDRYLLCSDGVSDLVDDDRLAAALRTVSGPFSCAAGLVAQARANGGTDNITAVVLDVIEGPRVVPDGACHGALADVANVVDAFSVRTG